MTETYLTEIETHVKTIAKDFKTILWNFINEAVTAIKDQKSQALNDKRAYKESLRKASTNNQRLKEKVVRVNTSSQKFQAQIQAHFNELE